MEPIMLSLKAHSSHCFIIRQVNDSFSDRINICTAYKMKNGSLVRHRENQLVTFKLSLINEFDKIIKGALFWVSRNSVLL